MASFEGPNIHLETQMWSWYRGSWILSDGLLDHYTPGTWTALGSSHFRHSHLSQKTPKQTATSSLYSGQYLMSACVPFLSLLCCTGRLMKVLRGIESFLSSFLYCYKSAHFCLLTAILPNIAFILQSFSNAFIVLEILVEFI